MNYFSLDLNSFGARTVLGLGQTGRWPKAQKFWGHKFFLIINCVTKVLLINYCKYDWKSHGHSWFNVELDFFWGLLNLSSNPTRFSPFLYNSFFQFSIFIFFKLIHFCVNFSFYFFLYILGVWALVKFLFSIMIFFLIFHILLQLF